MEEKNNKIQYTGERFVPNFASGEMEIEHIQRYLFAKEFVLNKYVLDVACGDGYGSQMLSDVAQKVIGIDIDSDVITNAQKIYPTPDFNVGNINKLPFEDNCFDCVVSFETIEHVEEELQQSFLEETIRLLKHDGFLIISTPNKKIYTEKVNTKNPYHKKEFGYTEFTNFLKNYYKYVYVFNQYFLLGYFLTAEGKKPHYESLPNTLSEDARYYVVICSQYEMNINVESSFDVFDNSMYFNLSKHINALDLKLIHLKNQGDKFQIQLENDLKIQNNIISKYEEENIKKKKYIEFLENEIKQHKQNEVHLNEDIAILKEDRSMKDKILNDLTYNYSAAVEKCNDLNIQTNKLTETLIEILSENRNTILTLETEILKLTNRISHPIQYCLDRLRKRRNT